MKTVQIAQLKARLSRYLRAVKSGEDILITDRGRPVARLEPVRSVESSQRELVEAGLVRPARKKPPASFWSRLPLPELKGAGVLQALLEERNERR